MRESVRVLIVDDDDRNLEPVRQALDQFENVSVRYATSSEEATFALGAHYHVAIINVSADIVRQTKQTLLRDEAKSPMWFALQFKEHREYGTQVIPIDVRSEERKQQNDHLQSIMWQLRNDIFAIIATPATIIADITRVMRHMPHVAPLRKRPAPVPPPPPPPPPTPPEQPLRFDRLAPQIEGSMDDQTRNAFEAFKAGREARNG